jgi:glycosyltransferase involved in cell wall biosynthesis
MRIAFVTNAPPDSGMGKPATLLLDALRAHAPPAEVIDEYRIDAAEHTVRRNGEVVVRLRPWGHAKPLAWLRLGRALKFDGYDLVHLTNQTLAFLVSACRAPTVVTVWDLIELENPQERGGALAARILTRGLPRATHLLTVSNETARALQRLCHIPGDRISVVPPAPSPAFMVQPGLWDTVGGQVFLATHHIDLGRPRVLYVGSEHPRKNLPRLLEALAHVRERVPTVEFVKIGGASSGPGRAAFVRETSPFRVRCPAPDR